MKDLLIGIAAIALYFLFVVASFRVVLGPLASTETSVAEVRIKELERRVDVQERYLAESEKKLGDLAVTVADDEARWDAEWAVLASAETDPERRVGAREWALLQRRKAYWEREHARPLDGGRQ